MNCQIYPLPQGQQAELDKFIDEHLRKGYIRRSKPLVQLISGLNAAKKGIPKSIESLPRFARNSMNIRSKIPIHYRSSKNLSLNLLTRNGSLS